MSCKLIDILILYLVEEEIISLKMDDTYQFGLTLLTQLLNQTTDGRKGYRLRIGISRVDWKLDQYILQR